MTAIIKGIRNDSNSSQATNDLDPGFLSMTQSGHLKVDVQNSSLDVNSTDPSIYTSQTDSYTAGTSKCQLLCGIRNDSSSTTLANTNNRICPLSVNEKGVIFTFCNGISGSVAVTNSDITTMKNDIATLKNDIASMLAILSDVHDSSNNRLRVHAQAL